MNGSVTANTVPGGQLTSKSTSVVIGLFVTKKM